jgi:hypothetical protein
MELALKLLAGVASVITVLGITKLFIEPLWTERNTRKQLASFLWLSCRELRLHLVEIHGTMQGGGDQAASTRDSLLKIPTNDYRGDAGWFVKTGYLTMLTAYKIAAFSAWLRIYQNHLLTYSFFQRTRKSLSFVYKHASDFKIIISRNTILWYYYIDAIGDRICVARDSRFSPITFAEFCGNYFTDPGFRGFFDQLHMFLHFVGRTEPDYARRYREIMPQLISKLEEIETYLHDENLLIGLHIEHDRTTGSNMRDRI